MMNIRMAIALALPLLGFGEFAQAATLASAPNYGGATVLSGGTVSCRLFNGGAGTATITNIQIFANSNASLPLTTNTCTSGLKSNQSCEFDAAIPGNLAFACRVTYSGTGLAMRGVTEIRDNADNIVNDVLMQ